jgi:two-component system sensor histidine kinase PilS (NtrC family)
MEERLREESALARIGALAAMLAHEVKNPLAAISGAVQMIAYRLEPDAEERTIVKEVLRRIDGLTDLLGDVLLYARPPKPQPVQFDLRELIESQVTLFKADPAWQGLVIDIDGVADDVCADPEQIKIAIENLVMNGVQAMGGTGELRIRIHRAGTATHVDVIDTGGGMPDDIRAKVFTPFFTTKARGTGLGLATVRRILESHGGEVSIVSSGSSGTTMRLSLPAAHATP